MADVGFELSSVGLLRLRFLCYTFQMLSLMGKVEFGSGRTIIAYNKRVFISLLIIISVSIFLLKTFKILH